jgi:hypothetical protein
MSSEPASPTGLLYGIKTPLPIESGPINGAFTLAAVDNFTTGAALQTQSNALDVTNFARPEDGQWADADTFYFVTTGADPDNNFPVQGVNGPIPAQSSRLYRLDYSSDYLTGQVTMVLDSASLVGTDGQAARSFDNMTVDGDGMIYIQEDPGNTAYIAKTWRYNPFNDSATQLLESDRSRFFDAVIETPVNILPAGVLTIDEESSGVIDITDILNRGDGKRYFLGDMQAHYANGPSLIEGGQLYALSVSAVPEPGTLALGGLGLICAAMVARRK